MKAGEIGFRILRAGPTSRGRGGCPLPRNGIWKKSLRQAYKPRGGVPVLPVPVFGLGVWGGAGQGRAPGRRRLGGLGRWQGQVKRRGGGPGWWCSVARRARAGDWPTEVRGQRWALSFAMVGSDCPYSTPPGPGRRDRGCEAAVPPWQGYPSKFSRFSYFSRG